MSVSSLIKVLVKLRKHTSHGLIDILIIKLLLLFTNYHPSQRPEKNKNTAGVFYHRTACINAVNAADPTDRPSQRPGYVPIPMYIVMNAAIVGVRGDKADLKLREGHLGQNRTPRPNLVYVLGYMCH